MAYINGKEILFSPTVDIEGSYSEGKQAEHKAFWDSACPNPNIYSGNYKFAGTSWTDTTFKPNISLIIYNAASMFNMCNITDLAGILDRQGLVFDFSPCTNFSNTFAYAKLTTIPVLDTTGCSVLSGIFYDSRAIHTIEKLILKSDGSQTFSNLFYNCQALVNIVIEGVIGQSGFNMQWSTKLSKASIESIINALDDETKIDANGNPLSRSITLSREAVQREFREVNFETGEAIAGDESGEWNWLIGTVSGWTIVLA